MNTRTRRRRAMVANLIGLAALVLMFVMLNEIFWAVYGYGSWL